MKRNKPWTKEYEAEYKKQYAKKYKERINKQARERRLRDVEKYRESDRQYYEKNKEKYWQRNLSPERQEIKKAIWKKSHIKNKEKRNKYNHGWYLRNKERVAGYNKERLSDPKNRERFRGYWRAAMKRRMADPNTQIRHNLRVRMKSVLKGIYKSAVTMKLVGCTIEELWKHLESCSSWEPWMTRENYGAGGWDLDHIKACATFDLTDPAQQRECFHWSNLQPLEHIKNIKKGAR
tara:strand:- start:64 stop:768 length:705 start_codon:yes stop_codon:yes gene_type:complete